MSAEIITAISSFVTSLSLLVVAITAYFKLRDKLDETSSVVNDVHKEVNSRYTELFARLDNMTFQRDEALKDK